MAVIQRQAWPENPIIKSSHRPQRWKEPSSSSNPQSDITSEEHLKILLRILSTKSLIITSLFHQCEYSVYVFVQIDTISIRTQSGRRNYRRSKYNSSESGIQPTSAVLFRYTSLHWVLNTMFTGTSLPGYYRSKSIPKNHSGRTRSIGELLLVELDQWLSLGKDEERERGFR